MLLLETNQLCDGNGNFTSLHRSIVDYFPITSFPIVSYFLHNASSVLRTYSILCYAVSKSCFVKLRAMSLS